MGGWRAGVVAGLWAVVGWGCDDAAADGATAATAGTSGDADVASDATESDTATHGTFASDTVVAETHESDTAGESDTGVASDTAATDTTVGTGTAASETTVGTDTTQEETTLQGPGTAALMELMQASDGKRYQDAIAAGVQFLPTSDGESFYAYWIPPGFDPAVDGFVVTLPGHDTFASSAFAVWKPHLATRHYGFIGLQWWLGGGEATSDYLVPDTIYRDFVEALAAHGIPAGKVLFEGFSRGAANSYAVTARDRASAHPQFILTIANAGGAATLYPPNMAIDQGAFGDQPFAGSDWVMYCGEKDPDPEQSGCPGMTRAKAWVEAKGGTVDLFIQDPTGDHGGFNLHPANVQSALDVYDDLRTP